MSDTEKARMVFRRMGRFTGYVFMAFGVYHCAPFLPWWGRVLAFFVVSTFAEWVFTGRLSAT